MKAGLNASLELQCRETMEIRTKHLRASFEAGFEAGLEASSLWKLKQNNMTKKGPFFGPQNVRKSRRAKMGLPSRYCPNNTATSHHKTLGQIRGPNMAIVLTMPMHLIVQTQSVVASSHQILPARLNSSPRVSAVCSHHLERISFLVSKTQ